jgi:hypothetical protein
MGELIDFEAYRKSRRPDPVERLDRAMGALEPILRTPQMNPGRVQAILQAELPRITEALGDGRIEEAAERVERLSARLSHASALGS